MQLVLLLILSSAALASTDCGTRRPVAIGGKSRILGGNNVTVAGKWPWMVFIQMRWFGPEGPFIQKCGGTIINDKWILTAAHCVRYLFGGKVLTVDDAVILGEVTSSNSSEILNSVLNKHTYRVRKAHPHANYTEKLVNDIALLELEESINFDSSVSPVCIPSMDQNVPADGQAVATGFGAANNRKTGEMVRDEHLRETIVPIVREDICEDSRVKTGRYSEEEWREFRIICAGAIGHDTRGGDSGGPLMMKSAEGRWFQIGITSFGDDGTIQADARPGIYTDVREYCEWITETTKGEVNCQEEQVILQDVQIKI